MTEDELIGHAARSELHPPGLEVLMSRIAVSERRRMRIEWMVASVVIAALIALVSRYHL